MPTNNLLVFVTGGLGCGRVDENAALNSGFNGGISIGGDLTGPNCFLGNSSRIGVGWTAGAGVEYALWNNLTLKVEYLFVNLGRGDTTNVVAVSPGEVSPPATPSSFTGAFGTPNFQVVRGGGNWKF